MILSQTSANKGYLSAHFCELLWPIAHTHQ